MDPLSPSDQSTPVKTPPKSVAAIAADSAEYVGAFGRHFGERFVTTLQGSASVGDVVVLCTPDVLSEPPAIRLKVTDCVHGLFCRRLGELELIDMRRDAGMAEFGWSGFLRLLAAALRSTDGCSTTFELSGKAPCLSVAGLQVSNAQLTLRFKLQAAALVSRVALEADASLSTSIGDPQAYQPAVVNAYLGELRKFMVDTIAAAHQCARPIVNSIGDAVPNVAKEMGSPTRQSALASGGAVWRALSPVRSNLASLPASTFVGSGGLTVTDGRHEVGASAPVRPVAPVAPKKRAGASLVDPGARRVPRVGANPFQLKR